MKQRPALERRLRGLAQSEPSERDPESRGLHRSESAEQKRTSWRDRASQGGSQHPERPLEDIGHDQIKARAPAIRGSIFDLNLDRMRVELAIGPRGLDRLWIDVCRRDKARTARPRDSGQDSCASTDVQDRAGPELPAKQIDCSRAEPGGGVSAVAEGTAWNLGEREPTRGKLGRLRARFVDKNER